MLMNNLRPLHPFDLKYDVTLTQLAETRAWILDHLGHGVNVQGMILC